MHEEQTPPTEEKEELIDLPLTHKELELLAVCFAIQMLPPSYVRAIAEAKITFAMLVFSSSDEELSALSAKLQNTILSSQKKPTEVL